MAVMPVLAILLSVLGLVPFVVCGLAAVGPDAATSARMLHALISYAAVILAFAGGIHWGFELQSPQEDRFTGRARFGASVVAPLIAWIALLLPLVIATWSSLIVLIAAYIAAVLVEQRAAAPRPAAAALSLAALGLHHPGRRDAGDRADASSFGTDRQILKTVLINVSPHDLLTIRENGLKLMSDSSPTAQIIPFPARQPNPDDAQERLRRALAGLENAIAGQRAAVAAWRKALGELGTVVSGLGESLQRYRGNLDTLGDRVAGLHTQAVKLEQTADAALAAPRN